MSCFDLCIARNETARSRYFPKQNYNVLSSSFHIHVSVSDLYITRSGLPVLLQPNRPRSLISGNTKPDFRYTATGLTASSFWSHLSSYTKFLAYETCFPSVLTEREQSFRRYIKKLGSLEHPWYVVDPGVFTFP
jgi:hypothetical protein